MARATSRVDVFDHFARIDEFVERRSKQALDAAARRAATVFEQQSGSHDFGVEIVPAHGDFNGFSSGIRVRNKLYHVFDHGSLGSRRGRRLKDPRRKETWEVRQRRRRYTAHRHPEALTQADKGVAPLNLTNPARTAGRKTLLAELRR